MKYKIKLIMSDEMYIDADEFCKRYGCLLSELTK